MSEMRERLAQMGLELPRPPVPIANFMPFTRTGGLVFLAGQVNEWNGTVPYVGKLGEAFDLDAGVQAARLCALNLIACLEVACEGDLDRVQRCLRLGGFVNCIPTFNAAPAVVNGASDLMVALWGDRGRHARTAVGVASLPRGAAVEVDGIFEISE